VCSGLPRPNGGGWFPSTGGRARRGCGRRSPLFEIKASTAMANGMSPSMPPRRRSSLRWSLAHRRMAPDHPPLSVLRALRFGSREGRVVHPVLSSVRRTTQRSRPSGLTSTPQPLGRCRVVRSLCPSGTIGEQPGRGRARESGCSRGVPPGLRFPYSSEDSRSNQKTNGSPSGSTIPWPARYARWRGVKFGMLSRRRRRIARKSSTDRSRLAKLHGRQHGTRFAGVSSPPLIFGIT
jgi:hypothetical protein